MSTTTPADRRRAGRLTVTAAEDEALGFAVDQFRMRADDLAERRTGKGGDQGSAALIAFHRGVAGTLEGLRARCTVTPPS